MLHILVSAVTYCLPPNVERVGMGWAGTRMWDGWRLSCRQVIKWHRLRLPPGFNTEQLFVTASREAGWAQRDRSVTPLHSLFIQERSSIWAAVAHFHANNGVAIFFPQPFANSFLQMMCHYKEVYLNKFNTSLINSHRAPFERSHATSEWARYPPYPRTHTKHSPRY